jgi:hypothetical protein
MEKKRVESSWEKKREERFKRWLSPNNINFTNPEAEKKYREKVTRIIKVVKLEKPDRVPVMLPTQKFPIHYAGTTLHKVMYDYDELRRTWLNFYRKLDLDVDVCMGADVIPSGRALEVVGYKLYKWPGHGLPTNSISYQYTENEYMKADEYDDLIKDPTDFWLRTYMPRICGAFEPFSRISPLTSMYVIGNTSFAAFGNKDVQTALKALLEAGQESLKWEEAVQDCNKKRLENGFPELMGGIAFAPFDILGATLRGTQGIMLDMYRQPDKLCEAMERLATLTIDSALETANSSGNPFIGIGLLKGDDGFMSHKQYVTFYWPTLKKVILGMVNEGLVPFIFAEGGYNTRLDIIKELPKASVVWQFDKTDIFKAKKTLGEVACIAGNVSSSMLITGTPRTVKEYCRSLIEICGKNGGYILAAGSTDIENAKLENLLAMVQAAKEYGVNV